MKFKTGDGKKFRTLDAALIHAGAVASKYGIILAVEVL